MQLNRLVVFNGTARKRLDRKKGPNFEGRGKGFRELIPVLSSHHLSFKIPGYVYSACKRNAMLHASEIWSLTKPNLRRLQRNDRAMIRQICNVKPQDTTTIRSTELLAQLSFEDLDLILKERRLRWYDHLDAQMVQSGYGWEPT